MAAPDPAANWSADYPQCNHRSDLLKHGSLNLGVRLNTANPVLAQQFRRAMDFWASVLDLEWHEDSTDTCSMEVSDGERQLFEPTPDNMVARSQFPDRRDFQGWIVFNPAVKLTPAEYYRISVHEIGHMFGLRHNSNTRSVMYDLDLECSEELDATDLAALRARHKLRVSAMTETVKFAKPASPSS
jgi:Matrixin